MGGFGAPPAPPMAPGSPMGAMPPQLVALLAALGPQMGQQQPIVSQLDRFTLKNYGVMADQAPDAAMDDLLGLIRKIANSHRTHWQARNDRIVLDDDYYNLKRPEGGSVEGLKTDEQAAQNAEIVISPLPRLVVDKLVAMLAGADWPIEVPARTADGTAQAQKIENLLIWFTQTLSRQVGRGGGESLKRKVAMSGVLTGWMTALMLPDPENKRFPWRVELEDPCVVFPTFGRDGVDFVTRQLTMEVSEARNNYPEAEEMLDNYDDDTLVNVVGYYDKTYRYILIEGQGIHEDDSQMVLRPVRHHCQTLEGDALCPWIIHLPNGRGFRGVRRMMNGSGGGQVNDTASVGVGALYAMRDSYDLLNKIASQLATNVARDANPAIIQFLQPNQEPTEITTEPGGRSYMVFQRNSFEVIKTTPSPGDLQPLIQMVTDWLQKATLPSVFWGDGSGGLSGFAVGLLTNAAKDVLLAYADGMVQFLNMLYERCLVTLLTAYDMGVPPVTITRRIDQGRLVGGTQILPQDIMSVGTEVDVQFQDLTPADRASAVQTEMAATTARLHSRETAMREIGVQDTELEKARIDLDAMMADPVIAAQMADLRMQNPGISVWDQLVQAHRIKMELLQQQMAAQQAEQNGGQAPPPKPGMPAQTLPSQMQPAGANVPPGREDAGQQQQRAGNQVTAQLLATQGGSQPAPGV